LFSVHVKEVQFQHFLTTSNAFSSDLQVFVDNKRRILALKGSLGMSAFSYQNLSWRLEVEVCFIMTFRWWTYRELMMNGCSRGNFLPVRR